MARARPRLVGREADLSALRGLVNGDTTLVLLSGDAGVGKSRVLAELLADQGDVLVGSCLPLRNRIPLLPFQEMFSSHRVRRRLARAASTLPPGLVEGLRPILPEELTAAAGTSTTTSEPEIVRSFAGVRAVLASLAGDGPLVAAVEDVHWSDPATRDLLTFLATQLRDAQVTVVATYRTDDPDGRAPEVVEWLSHVQRAEGAEPLALERLDRQGTAALVEAILGEPAPAAIVDSVFRRGEGNPFFTEQLVAAMMGTFFQPEPELPRRLADFLRSRIRNTSAEGARLLEALAVAARPLYIGALVDVAGLDERVGRRELATLVDAALVEIGAGEVVRARHALLNEAVLRELPATDRSSLHRRLAGTLAADHGDALASEIAGHWQEAGDPVQELVWTEKAADVAWSVGAFGDAARLLHRLLALSDQVDGGDELLENSVIELWWRAVRATDWAGDRRRSDQMAEDAVERFAQWPDPVERARLLILRAHQRILNGESGGLDLLSEVMASLETEPVTYVHVEARLLQATTLVWTGNSIRAVRVLEETLRLNDETTPALLQARLLCRLAQALHMIGDGAGALRALERAAEIAGSSEDHVAVVEVAVARSDFHLVAGELEETREVALEAYARAQEHGLATSWMAHVLLFNAALAALEQGLTEEAAELVVDLTDHPLRADADILDELRAEVDLRRGRVQESLTRVLSLDPISARAMDDRADRGTRTTLILRWADRPAQALGEALSMAQEAEGTDADYQSSLLTAAAGAAADLATAARARRDAALLEDARSASSRIRELSARFDGGTRPRVEKPAERLELTAELARADGRPDRAAWRAAAEEWDRLGRFHRAGYCWWRLGQALLDQDADRTEVKTVLRRAYAASDGHVPLRDAITELADRARIPLLDARPAGHEVRGDELPVHLTEQEVNVLRLVAAGMTNTEIGEQLFISSKTVSVHVSNVLRKLDVRSRVQAAAWADQVGLVRRPSP